MNELTGHDSPDTAYMGTTEQTIVAQPPHEVADPICPDDDAPGCIVHTRGPDCATYHGLRIVAYRCSVCDQAWGEGAASRHVYCARLYDDGSRRYADCVPYLADGRQVVYDRSDWDALATEGAE